MAFTIILLYVTASKLGLNETVNGIFKTSQPFFIFSITGAYDRETVEYVVNSEEGKKYWHFFKHMLLGSEEHYYVSLLYNWPRTKAFIQSLSAQSVWNTWKLGMYVYVHVHTYKWLHIYFVCVFLHIYDQDYVWASISVSVSASVSV